MTEQETQGKRGEGDGETEEGLEKRVGFPCRSGSTVSFLTPCAQPEGARRQKIIITDKRPTMAPWRATTCRQGELSQPLSHATPHRAVRGSIFFLPDPRHSTEGHPDRSIKDLADLVTSELLALAGNCESRARGSFV